MPARRKDRSRPEDAMQMTIVRHLRKRRIPGVFFFHVPNHKRNANYLKAMGMVSGVTDLILIRGGESYGLELKRPNGSVSLAQVAAHAEMRGAGVQMHTSYSVEDALSWLESNRLIRPASAAEAA